MVACLAKFGDVHVCVLGREATPFVPFPCLAHAKIAQELDKHAGKKVHAPRISGAWGCTATIYKLTSGAPARAVSQEKLHEVESAL